MCPTTKDPHRRGEIWPCELHEMSDPRQWPGEADDRGISRRRNERRCTRRRLSSPSSSRVLRSSRAATNDLDD